MTVRRLGWFGVCLAMLSGTASPAWAHRLDEYLQATRIGIDADRIVLEIDLTAGAAIAPRVFASIDADRNGRIDEGEQERYARRVLDAVQLAIDGHPSEMTLLARQFPALEEMTLGTGTIRLRATAATRGMMGSHRLVYLNAHAPDGSVYLVNALVPSDDRVELGAPHRDPLQRSLTLDFEVMPDPAWFRAAWVLLACAGIGLLIRTRAAHAPQIHEAVRARFRRTAPQS